MGTALIYDFNCTTGDTVWGRSSILVMNQFSILITVDIFA